MIKESLILAATIALLPLQASAATFVYETSGNLPGSTGAGQTSSISTSFDNETDLFNWSSTFTPNTQGVLPDGAWLVVNNGPNPKGNDGELAIAYLDESAEKVSFYEYNGANKSDSYLTADSLLASTSLITDRTADSVTFSFEYDATDLNSLDLGEDWKGLSFDDEIGIWFHGVNGLDTLYHGDELEQFIYQSQSWYDVSHKDTEKIPEPGTIIGLVAVGLASFGLKKKF